MQMAGVVPDLFAYTAHIRNCCRGRELERALNFLEEMR
jgi:pentatricopeptide repeat protein